MEESRCDEMNFARAALAGDTSTATARTLRNRFGQPHARPRPPAKDLSARERWDAVGLIAASGPNVYSWPMLLKKAKID